jgi:hypothetical protein
MGTSYVPTTKHAQDARKLLRKLLAKFFFFLEMMGTSCPHHKSMPREPPEALVKLSVFVFFTKTSHLVQKPRIENFENFLQ